MLLTLFIAGQASSQSTMTVHVSGTVTRDNTGVPVPEHQVIIQADSNAYGFTFYATRMTSSTGTWDCTIHDVPATGSDVNFIVQTKNCDSTVLSQTFTGTPVAATVNFSICNGNVQTCEAAFESRPDLIHSEFMDFYDRSYPQGFITAWEWNFGDTASGYYNVSTLQNPDHWFSHTGTFTVCLTIQTSTGCSSTRCHEVNYGSSTGCTALYNFYADSTNLLNIHFYDASTSAGTITSRHWNFGDGGTATTYDPWHVYEHLGTYYVCLRITTSDSCTSEKCDSIRVGAAAPGCESWITYTPDFLTVHFEGHTHSLFTTTYSWEMGDSASTTLTGRTPSFTFPAAGNYTITLVTVDSIGCTYAVTQTIYVHSTCDVNGYVSAGGGVVDHATVDLIRVDGGAMTVVDTKEISDSMGMYWFGGVSPGHYYLRATLLPSSALFGQYIPTYYIHAANWGDAHLVELGEPANPYNIELVHALLYSPGTGTIGGTISQNATMSLSGTPAANVEVLIRNESSEPLAYTMTDTEGKFSFSNVAFGTYSIYPEMPGLTTTPTNVTLTNAVPSVSTAFTIQGSNILGIHDLASVYVYGVSEIYPNPAIDQAHFTVTALQPTGIMLSVMNVNGQVAIEYQVSLTRGTNQLAIPVSKLSAGLYYVSVKDQDGIAIVRKMIIRN